MSPTCCRPRYCAWLTCRWAGDSAPHRGAHVEHVQVEQRASFLRKTAEDANELSKHYCRMIGTCCWFLSIDSHLQNPIYHTCSIFQVYVDDQGVVRDTTVFTTVQHATKKEKSVAAARIEVARVGTSADCSFSGVCCQHCRLPRQRMTV